jgi:hypothetical protein
MNKVFVLTAVTIWEFKLTPDIQVVKVFKDEHAGLECIRMLEEKQTLIDTVRADLNEERERLGDITPFIFVAGSPKPEYPTRDTFFEGDDGNADYSSALAKYFEKLEEWEGQWGEAESEAYNAYHHQISDKVRAYAEKWQAALSAVNSNIAEVLKCDPPPTYNLMPADLE